LYFEAGKIAGDGSHSELCNSNLGYIELVKAENHLA
jgi:ABC-type multidrug transport system fused ATPase/permease subunit